MHLALDPSRAKPEDGRKFHLGRNVASLPIKSMRHPHPQVDRFVPVLSSSLFRQAVLGLKGTCFHIVPRKKASSAGKWHVVPRQNAMPAYTQKMGTESLNQFTLDNPVYRLIN
jgi:hypothetical protein